MRRPDPPLLNKVGLALCIGLLLHIGCFAQCTNSLGTRSYDTLLTNNGLQTYNLSFPQWSPDSGQLVSVTLSANVTSTYGFTLRNVNSIAATYDLYIGQEDQISPAYGTPYTNYTPQHQGTYNLSPGQSQIAAPFPFLTNHVSSDSLTTNVTPFLGNGNVSVTYTSFTYTNLVAYNFASYYFSNTINSATRFSVKYLYCNANIVLAAELTRWSASLTAPHTVQLDWSAVNEQADRQYDIQRSSDGSHFTTIATTPADAGTTSANYEYTDVLPADSSGNWYYRLQIREAGRFSWSAVKEITVTTAESNLRIYPNPATDYINIATGTAGSDWRVDILSASGSLVQSETRLQSNLLHIPFRSRLSAGTYFARITDLRGQKVLVSTFVVRCPN